MSLTITNKSNRFLSIILSHPEAKRKGGPQRKNFTINGKTVVRRIHVTLPDSMMLASGGSRSNLPDYVAEIPAVVELVRKGLVAIEREDFDPKEEAPKEVKSEAPKKAKSEKAKSKKQNAPKRGGKRG